MNAEKRLEVLEKQMTAVINAIDRHTAVLLSIVDELRGCEE